MEIEGQQRPARGQHPVRGPAPDRDQRQGDVPQRPAPQRAWSRRTPTSSRRTRGRSASAPATSRIAYRPIAFDGTFDADRGRGRDDVRRRHRRCPPATPQALEGDGPLRSRRPPAAWSPRTACRSSRCSTSGPAPGSSSSTCRRAAPTSSPTPARWVDPTSGELQVRFVNAAPGRHRLPVPGRDRGDRPMTGIVRATGLVKRYDRTLAVGRPRPRRRRGRDLRPRRPERRRQDDDPADPRPRCSSPTGGDAEIAGASVRRNPNDVRRVLGFMPDSFGVYDDMKVWEYLDFFARCYGIPRRAAAADDRRPARARGPGLQARHLRRRASRAACSSACASPTRWSTTRRCCCSTSRRPAWTRAPASSSASSSASCGPWARRSSSRPTSSPSSRSCAPPSRSSTAGRCWPTGASPTSSAACGWGPSSAPGSSARARSSRPRAPGSPASRTSSPRTCSTTARSRSASTATTRAPPGCWRRRSAAGLRVASFARAASDLEELFLQVTAPDPIAAEGAGMTAVATGPAASAPLRDVGTGIAAVGVKELRGRMRGRRAFVVLTIHLLLVAGFAWMIESLAERTFASGFGGSFSASADIGRQLFTALLMLLTLIVLVLAPASTAGRHQPGAREADAGPADHDADLLAGDRPGQAPVRAELGVPAAARLDPGDARSCSRSAASGPDDMVKGYVVLVGTAFAYGVDRPVRLGAREAHPGRDRHQPRDRHRAHRRHDVPVRVLDRDDRQQRRRCRTRPRRDAGPARVAHPAAARGADVVQPVRRPGRRRCAAPRPGSAASCSIISGVTGQNGFGGVGGDVQQLGVARDSYWPRSLAAMASWRSVLHRPVRPARLADPALALPPATPAPPARGE